MLARALAELPGARGRAARRGAARARRVRALGTPRRSRVIVRGLADRQPDVARRSSARRRRPRSPRTARRPRRRRASPRRTASPVEALEDARSPARRASTSSRRASSRRRRDARAAARAPRRARRAPSRGRSRCAGAGRGASCARCSGSSRCTAARSCRSTGPASPRPRVARPSLPRPGPVALDGTLDDYRETLRAAYVVVDPAARRTEIEAELAPRRSARPGRGPPRRDAARRGDQPRRVPGRRCAAASTRRSSRSPSEIIVTAMRTHQRYFAIEDATASSRQRSSPSPAPSSRTPRSSARQRARPRRRASPTRSSSSTRTRRLRARSSRTKLDGLVFQAKLGTVAEKARARSRKRRRRSTTSSQAARALQGRPRHQDGRRVPRAPGRDGQALRARLGRAARGRRRDPRALPAAQGPGDALPATDLGAMLAVADRIDTIVGCFAVGLEPTGSADPFGLRRAAIGGPQDPPRAQLAPQPRRAHRRRGARARGQDQVGRRRWASRSPSSSAAPARPLRRAAASPPTASTPRSPPASTTSPTPSPAPRRSRTSRDGPTSSRARCSSASPTSSTTRATEHARRPRRDARTRASTRSGPRSRRSATSSTATRAERAYDAALLELAELSARRSPRSSTRAASWSWIPIRSCATTGSALLLGSINAPFTRIADFRQLGGEVMAKAVSVSSAAVTPRAARRTRRCSAARARTSPR